MSKNRQSRLSDALFTEEQARTEAFLKPVARVETTAVEDPTPRQVVSDMKWEGDTWMSPEQLADVVTKKPRRGVKRLRALSPDPSRPPRPADPEEKRDESARRRDKDKVPSSKTYSWDETKRKWVLVDRPKVMVKGHFFSYGPIPHKQLALLESMLKDETTPLDQAFLQDELVPRLNRTHPVSLRLLDWLVVDYALEKGVAYRHYIKSLDREMIVVMHSLYTAWLHRFRRRHYDPFRRRHRIYFTLDGETYSTTVAQLHFFYMARLYGFLEYATTHLEEIETHMKQRMAETSTAKEEARLDGAQYRRKPLVSKAKPRAFISEGTFTLSFGLADHEDGHESEISYGESDEDNFRTDDENMDCLSNKPI